jgi:hypothetical protein
MVCHHRAKQRTIPSRCACQAGAPGGSVAHYRQLRGNGIGASGFGEADKLVSSRQCEPLETQRAANGT